MFAREDFIANMQQLCEELGFAPILSSGYHARPVRKRKRKSCAGRHGYVAAVCLLNSPRSQNKLQGWVDLISECQSA